MCAPSQEKKLEPTPPRAPMAVPVIKKSESESPTAPVIKIKTGSAWEFKPRSVSASPETRIPPRTTRTAPPRIDPAAASEHICV